MEIYLVFQTEDYCGSVVEKVFKNRTDAKSYAEGRCDAHSVTYGLKMHKDDGVYSAGLITWHVEPMELE